MPDLNAAIKNHQAEMALWWKRPIYIHQRKAFVKRNPICARCGRPTTTPGHSHEDYRDFKTYLNAVTFDKCEPLCNACNLMEKKGRKPCPLCVKGWHDPKCTHRIPIRYIGQEAEYCYLHRPEEEVKQSEDRKEVFKQLVKQSHSIQNAKRRALYQEMKRK